MSDILQWVLCAAIGLAAVSYLGIKYFVHKQVPGSACGKCKGCAATSGLEKLAQQDPRGSAALHRFIR